MLKLNLKQLGSAGSITFEEGKKKKPRLLVAIASGLLVILLAALAWQHLDDTGFFDSPMPLPQAAKPALPPLAAPASVANQPNDAPAPVELHSSAKSRQLADLLAEKQMKEAELAVQELNNKINKLNQEGQTPALIIPPPPASAGNAAPSGAASLPRVRSIKGLDGRLKAVLTAGGSAKTVKAGENFMSGKVERISLHGVQFKASDGTIHTLSFED